MKHIVWPLCCLACISLFAQAGQLYRWVDNSGKVYYGDVPPVGATDVEVMKSSEGTMSSEYIPYASSKAQQSFPVVLYIAPGCGEQCDQARSLLSKRGIPYSEKELRTKEEIDAFRKLTGSEVVPTLAVGKTILKGFQPEHWQNELDIAGYPKIAPYRAPDITPSSAKPTSPEKPATP